MSANRLTPEQRALISRYREKWQHIGLSTEQINQENQPTTSAQKLNPQNIPSSVLCLILFPSWNGYENLAS